jgi:ferredoxin
MIWMNIIFTKRKVSKMANINTKFKSEIEKYGAFDFTACMNCGHCTAVCPLVEEENSSFPRILLRYTLLGMENDIQRTNDPWLCYYCGECSESCPRQSNPGEMMMSLRRYLISVYDWTGLAKLFYKSKTALIGGLTIIALIVLGFVWQKQFDLHPIMHIGHYFEMFAILSVATIILIPNIIRMYWFTVKKENIKVPFKIYISELKDLILHFLTQKKFLTCEDYKFRWFEHLLIVYGYLLLLFTTVFLDWLATDYQIIQWFGYIVSTILFVFTFDFVLGRIKKDKEINKNSHSSDWLFVIWLFLMGFTAFLTRLFIDLDLIENNIWLYILHLIILAQWALIIVPFGKWSHFLYRPFAIYFTDIKNAVKK